MIVCFQNKSAENLLEFEKMAGFGFEQRDFRKVFATIRIVTARNSANMAIHFVAG